MRLELDDEPTVPLVHLMPRDCGRDGVPVAVTDGGVDTPNEFGSPDPEIAQIDPVEQHGHRPGAQSSHLRDGDVASVKQPQAIT